MLTPADWAWYWLNRGLGEQSSSADRVGRGGGRGGSRGLVKFGRRFIRATVGVGVLLAFTGGCSTVVFQEQSQTVRSQAVERDALIRAAAEVSATKWPKPEGGSFGNMLASVVVGSGDRVTESDAVDQYLQSLGSSPDRRLVVLADAERHLAAATALAQAAEAAADGVRPAMSDISIVEGAIGDLRSVRDIYIASLKRLSKEGESVDSGMIGTLRSAFNDSIERVGRSADRLADAVAHDRTETLADRPLRRANFAGSL